MKDALRLKLIKLHPEVYEFKEQLPGLPLDIQEIYASLLRDLIFALPIVYNMKLKPDAQPVIRPLRKDRIAKKYRIKQKNGNDVEKQHNL